MKQWFCPCFPWYFWLKELQCAALSYRGSRHAQSQTVKSRTAVAASQQLFRWPKYKLSALHSNELWKEREAKVAFRCARRLEHFGENFGVKGAAALLTTSAYINQNCSKKVAIFQLAHSIFSPVCSHLLLRCSRRVRSCGLRILAPCLYKMTWACHILFAVMSCDTKKHKFNFVAVDYYSASSSSHNHILNLLLPTLMTQISFITLPSLSQQES